MKFTRFQLILAAMLTIAGSINTLAGKWMDMIDAEGSDGKVRKFEHPFLQSDILFFGEIFCLITFKICYIVLSRRKDGSVEEHKLTKGSRAFNPLIFWPPCLLDIIATTLMFFGLTLTTASSFQMLRGSIIIFTALLSRCILKRKILFREFIGIALIALSMITIGLTDMFFLSENVAQKEERLIGNIMIVIAQFFGACQYVYEEVFVVKLDIPPLLTVGLEGFFGFIILTIFIFPIQYIPLPTKLHGQNASNTLEDVYDAFIQIANNPLLLVPLFFFMSSIAFYNFSGVSLTKEINATTRMVLDSLRVFIIWAVSLAISWQKYHHLQLLGFAALILGICIYNDIYVTSSINYMAKKLKCRDTKADQVVEN